MKKKLTIVSVASEIETIVKTGGLADVARALPKALADLGQTAYAIFPLYDNIDRTHHNLTRVREEYVTINNGEKIPYQLWQGVLVCGLPVFAIWSEEIGRGMQEAAMYNQTGGNARFALFNYCVIDAIKKLELHPDIIHCHEWHTGLIPYLLQRDARGDSYFTHTATVFTIHNLIFQLADNWWEIPQEKRDPGYTDLPDVHTEDFRYINFTKRAIHYADCITTVSEWYANEILTKEFGEDLHRLLLSRKDRLYGIVNGIDYHEYNPATDPGLWENYTADTLEKKYENKKELQRWMKLPERHTTPLIALISRLSEQKGLELLIEIMEPLLRMDIQLVILGAGEHAYEKYFDRMRKRHATKLAAHLEFDTVNTTKVYAGADMLLMPSRFEPCGLGQLISLRYGTIPIVHAVGGLRDTITDYSPKTRKGNGFVFQTYDARDLLVAITRAWTNYRYPHTWQTLVQNAMRQVYSWVLPAQKYLHLYQKAIKLKKSARHTVDKSTI